jgi:Na+/melibiose symporter-like transporter
VLRACPEAPTPLQSPVRLSFARATAVVFSDKLLLRILASDLAVTTGQSIRSVLIVFFVTFYMGLPQWASGLFLLQFIFGIAAGPIWAQIGYRIGKHRAAVTGEIVQVAINLGLLLVTPDNLPLLLGLAIAQGLAQGSGNLMLRSMVADVADRHRLETGHDRTALFFSAFSLSVKAGTAIAIGIALPLVAWFGFDPKGANSPMALHGLLLVFALGPAIAHALSAALIHGFPLDEATHAKVRETLARRDAALVPAE